MNEVTKLLQSHQSIRKFTKQFIPDHYVSEIIRSAQVASTSSFVQAYSIVGVTDQTLKDELAVLGGNQDYIAQCPLFLVFCADLHRLSLASEMHGEPMKYAYTEAFIIATVDASLAAQNAMVAAESLGLGGVYIGGIRNNPEPISQLLNLPEKVYPVFGMCLGFPNSDPGVKPRLPLEAIYHPNRYNKDNQKDLLEQYDQQISQYYTERTGGKRTDSWTKQMSQRMNKEHRLHIKSFLENRGFGFK
ncbi:MAG: oxygen-insensitive NADPH nitroreductase [Bacilli bacterium]